MSSCQIDDHRLRRHATRDTGDKVRARLKRGRYRAHPFPLKCDRHPPLPAHAPLLIPRQVVTDLANASDRSQSNLPDRQSEIRVLRDTLTAKTDLEEKEEKKMLDRDMDDIGEGSARGTVRVCRGHTD